MSENFQTNLIIIEPSSSPQEHQIRQHKNEQVEQLQAVPTMTSDITSTNNTHDKQNQKCHLGLDQCLLDNHQENHQNGINEVINHQQAHQNEIPINSQCNESTPHFQRTINLPKSPFIKLESSRQSHSKYLRKSGLHIKQSHVTLRSHAVNENSKENLNAQSKLTIRSNSFFKKKLTNKNSYDQLLDKNLIQYLYTRQNKIFEEGGELSQLHKLPHKKEQIQHSRQLVRKCPTYQLANRLKLVNRQSKPFEIRTDCRNIQCNIFDAISCEQSRKLNDKFKHRRSNRGSEQVEKMNHDNRHELQILKNRMTKLQQTVYHKIPFLVEMGVKFKPKK